VANSLGGTGQAQDKHFKHENCVLTIPTCLIASLSGLRDSRALQRATGLRSNERAGLADSIQ
jgi:hypothetical protein